jgi:hypothetical protein
VEQAAPASTAAPGCSTSAVGDTLDEPNRSAFPKNKDALIAAPRGQQIFDLAHQLLIEMGDATEIEVYQHLGRRSEKFVHG